MYEASPVTESTTVWILQPPEGRFLMGMIPIGDDDSGRTVTPLVNYLLIAANIAVFVLLQGMGANDRFTYAFSTVPQEIVSGKDVVTPAHTVKDPASGESFVQPGLQLTPLSVYLTLLIAVFMHGGIAHLAGNMLYLWIFGDNVEDEFGPLQFLAFYLLCGIAATFAQFYFSVGSSIPNVGASGAIAGVLGAYIVMFPSAKVSVLVGRQVVALPAVVVLGMWIVLQLFSGVGSIAQTTGTTETGGVAYMAHVGGFAAGLLMSFLFRGRRRTPRAR